MGRTQVLPYSVEKGPIMRIWKQFTINYDNGGEYEAQLQDWGEDEKPRYRVTVSYDDGGDGYGNYFYSWDYDTAYDAKQSFLDHLL